MLKKAAAYPRYSSDNQREDSIEAQMKYIREYAQQNGYEIVKVYPDEAKTATSDRRPAFLEMINDSAKGLFEYVIVHKLDRFSRDRYDFAYYKRVLKKNGVRLISVLEKLDDSPESIMMEAVLEGMAEYYSKNLSREVMRKGMLPNAEKCKHNGGVPPLGYDVDESGHYIINEREAVGVQYIYRAYLDDVGYNGISDWLDAHGIKSKRGMRIAKGSIHDILLNEKYTGVYIYNRATSKDPFGKRNNRTAKPENEIIRIENGMPAIISKETFKKAAEKMNKNRSGKHRAAEPYLLSGICFCGLCGGAMVGSSRGRHLDKNEKKQHFYECCSRKRNHNCEMRGIKRDDIENAVLDYLEILIKPSTIDDISEWLTKNMHIYTQNRKAELKIIKSELSTVSRNVEKLLDKIIDGLDSPTARARLKELEDKKFNLEVRVTELETAEENTAPISKENIKGYLSQLNGIRNQERTEQARIVKHFVQCVTVHAPDPGSRNRRITVKTNLDSLISKLKEDSNGGGEGN